jgi:prepilin peptidase CpaA
MLTFAVLVLFPVLMAFAAFSDLFTMTISNRVSLVLLLGFGLLAPLAGLSAIDIAMHASCGVAILVLTFAMFAFGWIGGGDAKLAASTALWLGWEHLGDYGLIAALIGGVLTGAVLALRKWPLPAWLFRPGFMRRLAEPTSGVPYGIALAAAGILVYPDTAIWLHAAA